MTMIIMMYGFFIYIFLFQQSYQAINIRLVLTALEIQETDMFERSKDGVKELSNYGDYMQDKLTKTDGYKDLSIDHGFFLR